MANTNKVTITMEVEYCSFCPYGKVTTPIWDPELEEEVSDVICKKLGDKIVYHDLNWTECASRCAKHVNSIDTPPSCCPFNKK